MAVNVYHVIGEASDVIDTTETEGGLIFNVRVVARGSKSEVVGEHDGALKVRIAAPPVEGAANAELVRMLAKQFKVSERDVEIVGGKSSKSKRIKIANLSQSRFEEMIK